jgi:hypothetical protein
MKFIVRQNCEYSLLVEAEDGQEAIKRARATQLSDWGAAWSIYEADEEPSDESND